MKDILISGLAATMSLTLLIACAQPKGFQAHKNTAEDLMLSEYRKLTPQEQKRFANWSVQPGEMQKIVWPRNVEPKDNANQGPKVGDAAKPDAADGSDKPAATTPDDPLSANSKGGRPADFKPVPTPPHDDTPFIGGGAKGDANVTRQKAQERIDLLNGIAENGGDAAAAVIRGLDVSIRADKDKSAFVTVGSLLLIDGHQFMVNGVANVNEKNQLIDQSLVDLKLSAMDSAGIPTVIAGVEMFTACTRVTCDQVALFIQISAKDGDKTSVVAASSVFEMKDVASAETRLIGSTMGESIKSVQQARAELAAAAPRARPATGSETAGTGATSASAGSGDVRDLGVINVEGRRENVDEVRDLGAITVIGQPEEDIRDAGTVTVVGNRAQLLKEIAEEDAANAAAAAANKKALGLDEDTVVPADFGH